MSTVVTSPERSGYRTPAPTRIDDTRGRNGMRCLIATETVLFLVLFFSYFYLATPVRWTVHLPPELTYAFVMLAVLLTSSAVLHLGELQVRQGKYRRGLLFMAGTVVLGIVFLALQVMETREHWKTLTIHSDAYGSLFYTITGFHAAHLTMGLLILMYVLILPKAGHAGLPPYRPYHVAAMYWHFVDVVWIFIVAVLYVAPHFER